MTMTMASKQGYGGRSHAAPVELQVKQIDETGEFEGYASLFGIKDQGRDIVVAGAFAKSLARRPAEKIKMLWQHDPSQPIGKWLEAYEDERGLRVKGKILTSLSKGRECYEMMKEGLVDGLSIGYRTVDADYDRESETRLLKEVDLQEISYVTFPMLEEAQVTLVKGTSLPTEREFEQFLTRDAGFSAQQAKVIIAEGYKTLTGQRDADPEAQPTLQDLLDILRS